MNEIKIYKSPWKAIKLVFLCSIFVGLGIWLLTTDSPKWISWLGIGFFGLGYPVGIFNLLDRRPQIIINKIGIFDRTAHNEFINWELIQDAYPISISGQEFVCLVIDEEFKPSRTKNAFRKNVVKWNEALGAQELNINLGQVKMKAVELAIFISAIRNAEADTRNQLIKTLPLKT